MKFSSPVSDKVAPIPPSHASDAFVGRQPIYDRDLNLYAHELLFRSGHANAATFQSGNEATSQLVLDVFLDIGLERISEGAPVFVNIPQTLLTTHLAEILPPGKCVLEVLEDVVLDSEVVACLTSLRAAGYQLALDDFTWAPEKALAVDAVHIVKLDIRQHSFPELRQQIEAIRAGRIIKLLAEKIETLAEFRECRDLGFDYFQGYFLSRPDVVPGRRATVDLVAVTTLLQRCQDPMADVRTIAHLIGDSPSLSYKLLQAANSSLYSRRTEITSLHEAVSYLGTRFVSRLATLLLMAGVSRKPAPSLLIALQRACMCEILSPLALPGTDDEKSRNTMYMVGLLSGLDILLDQPIEEVMRTLPLSDVMKKVIVKREGPIGRMLQAVVDCQCNDWDAVAAAGVDARAVNAAYWESLPHVDEVRQRMGLAKKTD